LEVPFEARRVAALYGPAYEKVVMLGAEDKIVMCFGNHKNTWPWSTKIYRRLNDVQATTGTQNEPNMEELLKVNPDLVFYWNFPDPVKKLQEVGLPVVIPGNSFALADAKTSLSVYAAALGGPAPARAEAYAKYYDEKVKMVSDITSKIPKDKWPTVYFAVRNLLQTNGKASNVPELVNLAGGVCVNAEVEGGFGAPVTMEQLLLWDPGFVFIDQAAATLVGSKPAEQIVAETTKDERYKNLSAVKNSHIYVSPTGVFFWNAGQQVILQLVWIAKTLHPEEFAGVDMVAELKDFYSRFYNYQLTDTDAEAILLHQNPP
jgi:iron complex transport system substrate-binding protein